MKLTFAAATAAAALLVGSAQPSHATLMLKVSDGSTTQTLTDSGGTGAINFIGSIGSFIYNVVTGLSAPMIGSIDIPQMDLNFVDITARGGSGGTLTMTLTDTGFQGGGNDFMHFLSTIGGTINGGGSLSFDTYMDCGNTAFGMSTLLSSQTGVSGNPYSSSGDKYVSSCSGAYSLTELVSLQLPGSASISGDASLSVPEPSTIALFGVGLLGLGMAMRRKTKTMAI